MFEKQNDFLPKKRKSRIYIILTEKDYLSNDVKTIKHNVSISIS